MMALRLVEGLDRRRYARIRGTDFNPARLARLEELGVIWVGATHVRATPEGRRLLNAVLGELLAHCGQPPPSTRIRSSSACRSL